MVKAGLGLHCPTRIGILSAFESRHRGAQDETRRLRDYLFHFTDVEKFTRILSEVNKRVLIF